MDDVVREAWDEGVEAYERLRPGYPGAAVDGDAVVVPTTCWVHQLELTD